MSELKEKNRTLNFSRKGFVSPWFWMSWCVRVRAASAGRFLLSFASSARLKLRTTRSKRCDTCTNLHTGSTGVRLTRPRGQIYARRCLDACPRVHARRHFQIARPCRSIGEFLERSRTSSSRGLANQRRKSRITRMKLKYVEIKIWQENLTFIIVDLWKIYERSLQYH